MALHYPKPTSPGLRGYIGHRPEGETPKVARPKGLLKGKKSSGGRNHSGKITMRRRGGGAKRRLRAVDFKHRSGGGTVAGIHYDPNRSASLALILDREGKASYAIAVEGVVPGDERRTLAPGDEETKIAATPGNRMPLGKMPTGTTLCCRELKVGGGALRARSAGTSLLLMAKGKESALLRLPSGEVRKVPLGCYGTVGTVAGSEHSLATLGKAGRVRWRGRRPKVRGVAMNPVDHPHGGGEGKTSGGRVSVTPWSRPTRGRPTSRSRSKGRKK